ncbi:response regulator [Rhizobium sp. FKL33]|uniref:response regulator n=1 Tax=Rhizobium sp. FKL33 TaxID=2562307 RepID=UPI0010BFACED|nr:response regulator [Rhizobium sp. FKL33]
MDSQSGAARDCFNGKTFLVVDQDYFLVDAARRMIEEWGGSFVVFDSVRTAVEFLSDGRVDASILDIEIETEEAFLLCERLDELGIPFVFAFGESAGRSVQDHGGFVLRGTIDALSDIGDSLFSRDNVSASN